jgi:hypothetical protein
MSVLCRLPLIVTAVLGLVACEPSPPAATTQIVVQPPSSTIVPAAPMPPPPPMSELVPPPPPSSTPTIWQPGHWRYSAIGGNPWTWQAGQYVALPQGATAWVPGQWQQQSSGWVWREGHWA